MKERVLITDSFLKKPTDIVVTDIFMPGKDDYFKAAIDCGAAHCLGKAVSVEDMRG